MLLGDFSEDLFVDGPGQEVVHNHVAGLKHGKFCLSCHLCYHRWKVEHNEELPGYVLITFLFMEDAAFTWFWLRVIASQFLGKLCLYLLPQVTQVGDAYIFNSYKYFCNYPKKTSD